MAMIGGTINNGDKVSVFYSLTKDETFLYCKAGVSEGFYDDITIQVFKGYKAGLRVVDIIQFMGRVRALDKQHIELLPLRSITYIRGDRL
jgi:hypothetical protein